MALTATDLSNIKISIADVVDPRFAEMNQRFDETHSRLSHFQDEFESFASATNRKFYTAFTDIAITRSDINAVKDMITQHRLRITRLERGERGVN